MSYELTDEQYQQMVAFIQSLQNEYDQGWYICQHKRSLDKGQSWEKTNRGEVYQHIADLLKGLTGKKGKNAGEKNIPDKSGD